MLSNICSILEDMAKRIDKLRVAEASLYGATVRLLDLANQIGPPGPERDKRRDDAAQNQAAAARKVTELGGDPAETIGRATTDWHDRRTGLREPPPD